MVDPSENSLFLVGSVATQVEALAIANGLRVLVLHGDRVTEKQIEEVARRKDVSGIVATTPGVLLPTSRAASECRLPGIALDAVSALLSRTRLLALLADSGINVPPNVDVYSMGEAQARSEEVPGPWRVLSDHYGATHLKRRVIHSEDLPLAFSSVTKGMELKAATIESELDGHGYAVYGALQSGRFVPGAVFGQSKLCETDQLPMTLNLVSNVEGIAELCTGALEALGIKTGQWELELVACDNTLYLTHIHPSMIPSDPIRTLLRAGNMEGLIAHALLWAVGTDRIVELPHTQEVAMQWLSSRSGIVQSIEGVEEATGSEGALEVHLGVKVGDVIGHIVNRRERNALGYVVASATKTHTALENAERACECIHIQTGAFR